MWFLERSPLRSLRCIATLTGYNYLVFIPISLPFIHFFSIYLGLLLVSRRCDVILTRYATELL